MENDRISRKNWYVTSVVLVVSIMCVSCVIMMFTGQWLSKRNPYNSYTLQAVSWLNGRLDVDNHPALELAVFDDKYYVSFPPFPSYIMLPFAALFGENTPDRYIAVLVTIVGILYAVGIAKESEKCSTSSAMFWVLFIFTATGYCFIGFNGYVWFIAQSMGITLSLMAVYYALKGRSFASLTLWACSVGCRPMLIIYVPYLLYLLVKNEKKNWNDKHYPHSPVIIDIIKKRWWWAIGPCVIASSYMILNYMRFGSIFEFGHTYLPEFQRAQYGQFSLHYLSGNIKCLFRLPQWNGSSSPVVFPIVNGFNIFMCIPVFIVAVFVAFYGIITKKATPMERYFMPAAAVCYIFVLLCHRTMGGWHFGNRYLLDILPYVYISMLLKKPESCNFEKICSPLAVFGSALNIVGTIAVYNKWI